MGALYVERCLGLEAVVDPLAALATFAVIFPAELPDKSMFASVVLGTKFKPLPVWFGLGLGFLTHTIIAVTAGGVLSLLPPKLVTGAVALFFLAGGIVLLLPHESSAAKEAKEAEEEAEKEIAKANPKSDVSIAATAFLVIFVSEWGDLTQLATVNLAARYDDPLSVGLGAVLAEWSVTGMGVLFGRRLLTMIPLSMVRHIAGLILVGLSIWSVIDFFHT